MARKQKDRLAKAIEHSERALRRLSPEFTVFRPLLEEGLTNLKRRQLEQDIEEGNCRAYEVDE